MHKNMENDITTLSIVEAGRRMAEGTLTSLELTRACLQNIQEKNADLNAFLEVFADAEAQAIEADQRRARGETHPLLGIPFAVKDNILIEGKVASAASKMLEGYVATYDATVIQKLKQAGVVFVGRTNMDEFAMGGTTENSAFGPTKNPHDTARVAGGSSGGSAVAVASGMALAALGSDTGGSIREPASFCGIVGLKPTYGAVSRSGLMAMGSSLDQIGPFTRTAEDAKIVFDTIHGIDALDSTSLDTAIYGTPAEKKVIGVPRHLLKEGVDADVLALFEQKLDALRALGYKVVDIELPSAPLALALYYIIMPAEASSNLSRFDGIRYGLSRPAANVIEGYAESRGAGFGPEVRRRIMLGTYVLSAGYYDAYYGKAIAAREILKQEAARALEGVDVIATPTAPVPATLLGEKSDPLSMYLMDVFTVTANLTGGPAISIPMGVVTRAEKELPVGIQYTAAHGNESVLFSLGAK